MLIDHDIELKNAILDLPRNEKDKLLLKLISKNSVLMNQLHFKLLEQEVDMEHRIKHAKKLIDNIFEQIDRERLSIRNYGAKNLLKALRSASGIINEHFLITKDNYSEIGLRLYLLQESFRHYGKNFMQKEMPNNSKLLAYKAKRIDYILKKYGKIHEDFQLDYRDDLNKVIEYAFISAIKPYVEELRLPLEV